MTPAYLHEKLMKACENGNVDDVKQWLESGAEPNFNIKRNINALDTAVAIEHHEIIALLLEHGAIVKELVLQKAIEKNKNYLPLLMPNFSACKDESLLMGVLQAAINIGDLGLAKQAIHQGAKPESLFLSAILNLGSAEILELLIENGFDIHANKNMIVTEWMGTSAIGYKWKSGKPDLLAFISEYYIDKPESIVKFNSLGPTEKSRLFRMGLDSNHFTMMKFAFMIGANKNEALNSALYRYYAKNDENSTHTHATMFKNHKSEKVDYEIIEYILSANIQFEKITISNAVCFQYTVLLNALSCMHDLEYGYEMAYKYEDDDLQDYFICRGVSKEVQHFAKMKVSASKGNIKELRKAVNDGANLEMLDTDVIVSVINENHVEVLQYLYEAGVLFDTSLNRYLNKAMGYHKAYETITYLVELGFDITSVKNIPREYKKRYPIVADMWEKRFRDIFDYTVYLAREVHPKVEGKEKEEVLGRVAQLSALPYVVKRSKGKIA
jgi:ankyrin repeat protein